MKRLGILVLALAGLAALFGSCGGGGGEETGILAVAFRLDGEFPLVTAYFGDPSEDPLQLPAGRYYIEALDQDDLAISLGAVDIEEGDVVDFPPSFDAAGGSSSPERVESLKTVASFLIDVELSELVFLEAITGGFTLTPFDPAVEPDAASVQELFEIYADIAAQEDVLRAALSAIEGQALVSSGVLYVRSPWAPSPGLWDVFKKKAHDWLFEDDGLLSFMKRATGEGLRQSILQIAEQIPEQDRESIFNGTSTRLTGNAHNFDSWVEEIKRGNLDHELSAIYGELYSADPEAAARAKQRPIDVHAREGAEGVKHGAKKLLETYKKVPIVGKLIDTTEKALEWEEYAKKLAKDLGGTLDESARGRVQKALEDKVKSNLKERFPKLSDKAIDGLAQYFAKKAVAALPKPPSPLTPAAAPTATQAVPTPKATPSVSPAAPSPSASPSPTTEVTPGSGWIEGYVQGIASEWVAKCFKGDVKPYADALRQCLINAMMDGATEEQAKADCPPDVYAPTFPDAGWIEGYVGGIADQWLAKEIYSGFDVAAAADDMRQCLTDRFLTLCFSEEGAKAECPAWLFEPSLPVETPSPSPSPSPQPTPSPSPGGGQVTAVGVYTGDPLPSFVYVENKVTLVFDTRGGPIISGEGHFRWDDPDAPCPHWRDHTYHYTGNYSPESKTLSGTWENEWVHMGYTWRVDEGCVKEDRTSGTDSGSWKATLEDGVVRATAGRPFELTVQG